MFITIPITGLIGFFLGYAYCLWKIANDKAMAEKIRKELMDE